MTRNRRAPMRNAHAPNAVGIATSISLGNEDGTITMGIILPIVSPIPPITHVPTRRSAKVPIQLHPIGPNLLRNLDSMQTVLLKDASDTAIGMPSAPSQRTSTRANAVF